MQFQNALEKHAFDVRPVDAPKLNERTQMSSNLVPPAEDNDVLGRPRKAFGLASSRPVDSDPETYAIIGAAMEVHRELGNGFLEAVYHDALSQELMLREIPFAREHPIPITYKGFALSTPYSADFLCFQSIIVELKAQRSVSEIEDAQVLHYLKATGFTRALLLNFGAPSLQLKRLIRSQ